MTSGIIQLLVNNWLDPIAYSMGILTSTECSMNFLQSALKIPCSCLAPHLLWYIPSVHPFEEALRFSDLWSAAFSFPDLPCASWRASPPPADHWLLVIPDPLQVKMQPHLKTPQKRACPLPSLFRSEGTPKAVSHYNKWLEQVQHLLLLHLTHS